jgi:hypothetical protein
VAVLYVAARSPWRRGVQIDPEGRCLNTEFIAATDLGDWQDAILVPRDTPIEVNSEELFKWGGIANIDSWPKDVLDERRRKKIRTRGSVSSPISSSSSCSVGLRLGRAPRPNDWLSKPVALPAS